MKGSNLFINSMFKISQNRCYNPSFSFLTFLTQGYEMSDPFWNFHFPIKNYHVGLGRSNKNVRGPNTNII